MSPPHFAPSRCIFNSQYFYRLLATDELRRDLYNIVYLMDPDSDSSLDEKLNKEFITL